MKKKYTYAIGIDPDCDKSGVCELHTSGKYLAVYSFSFPELLDYLWDKRETCDAPFVVVVEAGWLCASNWHVKYYDSKEAAAKKGNDAGRNHETGRKIIEICKHWGIEVEEKKPLRKCWKGDQGKITHEELTRFYGMPELPKRTNQEVRDAILLAWNYSNLPIKIKS
jgi:hypothetical protein